MRWNVEKSLAIKTLKIGQVSRRIDVKKGIKSLSVSGFAANIQKNMNTAKMSGLRIDTLTKTTTLCYHLYLLKLHNK